MDETIYIDLIYCDARAHIRLLVIVRLVEVAMRALRLTWLFRGNSLVEHKQPMSFSAAAKFECI